MLPTPTREDLTVKPTRLLLSLALLCATTPLLAAEKKALGWVEEGLIQPDNIAVKMKLDTGARTSSLHAEDIERFDKDGDKWVRFKVELKDSDSGKQVSNTFERKIERSVKVRGAGGADRRPVVEMQICIGSHLYKEEFTLNDRDKMIYPVLIGRRTLENLGPVDVSRTFTQKPNCKKS